MKHYFSMLHLVLFLAGISDARACCWCIKNVDDNDITNKNQRLAQREFSLSTESISSDGKSSEQDDPPLQKDRRESFSIFAVCDGNFAPEVIQSTEKILLTTYQFNKESAQCFMWLRSAMNDFSYEGPLEKTRGVRKHALRFLNEREDFFPKDYMEDSKRNLVYALQVLLQKRYALLNYCMQVIGEQPTGTSEFFLDFPNKIYITQKFPQCLANFVARNPVIKMPKIVKDRLSQANTWATIITAFSSYPIKRNRFEWFWTRLDFLKIWKYAL